MDQRRKLCLRIAHLRSQESQLRAANSLRVAYDAFHNDAMEVVDGGNLNHLVPVIIDHLLDATDEDILEATLRVVVICHFASLASLSDDRTGPCSRFVNPHDRNDLDQEFLPI